jgi:oligopeptidase A
MTTDNPLLDDRELPAFGQIGAVHVEPAVDAVLAEHKAAVEAIGDAATPRDFAHVVLAKERVDFALERAWSPVSHLHAVADTPELRAAFGEAQPRLAEHGLQIGQDRRFYEAVRAVADAPGFDALPQAARRVVEHALRDFRLSGVALEEPARTRFREIGVELSRLSTEFSNAVLDATEAWSEHLSDQAALAGIPPSDCAMLQAYAAARSLDGWLVTLHQPAVLAVLTHADDRELRRRVYHAYNTRASDEGPDAGRFDNGDRIERIVALRHEAAQLLGFANSAELSLEPKMARSPDEAVAFLRDLAARARPVAERDLEEMRGFAAQTLGLHDLQPWDMAYVAEKLRRARYAIDEEQIKAYFPVPKVMDGVMALLRRLFGITLVRRDDVDVWHPDAAYYDLVNPDGTRFAGVYLDLYARAGKRGGAWMGVCRPRFRDADRLHLPIAYLTCNFAPPTGDAPSLLTHRDVLTLLHEFGHVLHHLLTEVDLPSVGGITGFEWDAVELPSQLMENFGWNREALDLLSGHHVTGETLPVELFDRMIAARRFQAGLFLVRQLEFALFDLRLHLEFDAPRGARVMDILNEVRREVAVVIPPAWNRFPHAFSHIFAGGYAAGYYSYLWAELLSADAFERFEEAGVLSGDMGATFRREVLAVGATRPAIESFTAFRGREPKPEALLRSYGLAA